MRASLIPLLSFTFLSPLAIVSAALAQTPPPAAAQNPQLSPQAAYQDALHPLEVTRHNIANWSDVEIAAMNVAISKAKSGCDARQPTDYTGSDLVDLARLCSLGQQWPAVLAAAGRYIAAPNQPKPLLPDAYIAQTEAHLRLKQEPEALRSALTLLTAVPYSTDVGECVDEAISYMRFVHTADALTLAKARQPLLLHALTAAATPVSAKTSPSAADPAPTPAALTPTLPAINELYADALLLPTLLQLAAEPAEAEAALASIEKTLPSSLPSDDALRIAAARHQYAFLGKPLTGIAPLTSLSSPANKLPVLPAINTITALLLFPDWCAQCVRLGPQLPETVFKVEGHSAYLYALLAETVPPRKPDPKITNTAFNPAYAAAMLAETPTVTVPPDTLTRFEAADFPLLLLTDATGILRVLQPITAQDLQPGGDLDAAIALIGRNFNHLPSAASNGHSSTP